LLALSLFSLMERIVSALSTINYCVCRVQN
jgi:hypothetical protein